MTIHKKHSRHFRGWESLGSELTNNQIDYREQVDIGLEQLAIEPAERPMRSRASWKEVRQGATVWLASEMP